VVSAPGLVQNDLRAPTAAEQPFELKRGALIQRMVADMRGESRHGAPDRRSPTGQKPPTVNRASGRVADASGLFKEGRKNRLQIGGGARDEFEHLRGRLLLRSQEEAGNIVPGTDPGAPAAPRLLVKALWTTEIARVIFAAIIHIE
jgi:hypothetical protein